MRIEALTHLYILRAKVATGWNTCTADMARSACIRRDASHATLLRLQERGMVTRVREGRRYRWEFTAAGAEYLRARYEGIKATLPEPIPRVRRRARSALVDASDEDILARIHAGETQGQIGAAYGCTRQAVQRRLYRMGVFIGGRRGANEDSSGGLVHGHRDDVRACGCADGGDDGVPAHGGERGPGRERTDDDARAEGEGAAPAVPCAADGTSHDACDG